MTVGVIKTFQTELFLSSFRGNLTRVLPSAGPLKELGGGGLLTIIKPISSKEEEEEEINTHFQAPHSGSGLKPCRHYRLHYCHAEGVLKRGAGFQSASVGVGEGVGVIAVISEHEWFTNCSAVTQSEVGQHKHVETCEWGWLCVEQQPSLRQTGAGGATCVNRALAGGHVGTPNGSRREADE